MSLQPLHPADERRVPDVADDPGPLGVVGGLGLADGPDDDAVHERRHLLLALDGGPVGRGQGREDRRHQLGLAAHGPQGPFEDVEDPLRGDGPRAGTWARRASSCSTQWTRAAARRWSLEVK